MSTRTLIPVFSKYSLTMGIDVKEPMEDFSFLEESDQYHYETFRKGLDSIPGSREYLKSYTKNTDTYPFDDEMGIKILWAAGNHHSGGSVVTLAWGYKNLLNNWDDWVKEQKIILARKNYQKAQLLRESTWEYANALLDKKSLMNDYPSDSLLIKAANDKIENIIQNLRTTFSITYSVIEEMMDELIYEFEENARLKLLTEKQESFNACIHVLEHHFKYPKRWDDYGQGKLTSSLFGSIYDITEEMLVAMEKKFPGYRDHINSLITQHAFRCVSDCSNNKMPLLV